MPEKTLYKTKPLKRRLIVKSDYFSVNKLFVGGYKVKGLLNYKVFSSFS